MEASSSGDHTAFAPTFPDDNAGFDGVQRSVLSSNLYLDEVGEVSVTLNSAGLCWKPIESTFDEQPSSTCLGITIAPKSEAWIKFSDVYAVEFISWGMVQQSVLPTAVRRLLGHDSQMYRFTVHGVQRSFSKPSPWVLAVYTFGHKDLQTCEMWVGQINAHLNMEKARPKNLLVFVHPMSGRKNGTRTWEAVAPIFSRAKVKTKVIVTKRAGHAFDVMASITNRELNSYDGVVAVGGDGFFNEILNGLLSSRFKARYPPVPPDFADSVKNDCGVLAHNPNEISANTSDDNEDRDPLLPISRQKISAFSDFNSDFILPNECFRFGIIPAGSTDAIVICTTGSRDPMTSALHIVLGKKVRLDIAQVVRWKTKSASKDEPYVRYAASFAGYGFYGDVITESEKYRWIGPKRYDYAGTKVFLRHRSYEAEVAYLEVKSEKTISAPEKSPLARETIASSSKSEKVVCRVNCNICNTMSGNASPRCPDMSNSSQLGESKWLRSKGRFLSIGAAVISCWNERAADGLVVDAHLSDGFLHLILIKDCPHAYYLWHLTELARKGGNPLKFDFVEHHKTSAFTFTSSGSESVWNLDGELFHAHKLSAQVFRGLVSLFASGPEI